jgi:hypothetical protein
MTDNITRSTGISVPGTALRPGGGYQGLTKALDREVQWQAKWLAKTFGKPVEIRFNFDREDGGAWLSGPDFPESVGVGLCVGLISPMTLNHQMQKRLDRGKTHYYAINVRLAWLRPSAARLVERGSSYLYLYADTLKGARTRLLKVIDRSKLQPLRKKP